MRDRVLGPSYEVGPPNWGPGRWLCTLVHRSLANGDQEAEASAGLAVWNEILIEASQAEAALAVLDA